MSLTSRVFGLFSTTANSDSTANTTNSSTSTPSNSATTSVSRVYSDGGFRNEIIPGASRHVQGALEEEEPRPPYHHAMLAGGTGGCAGDMLMHSLDTVKTRQQGDPTFPPKYTSMTSSYATIYRQEGFCRGLYSGVTPAFWGSFPGTVIFFGVYEFTKRLMLDSGINPSLAYLSGGFFADLAASVVYVPSEVLKTRLQLQGRYNNPHFNSGYNYRGTTDALRTIVSSRRILSLVSWEQTLAKEWVGKRDIGLGLEIATAATAGGMAGVITCPLDVVKTRIQTQQNPPETPSGSSVLVHMRQVLPIPILRGLTPDLFPPLLLLLRCHLPGAPRLDTSSVFTGLRMIYRTEGLAGWFRGVGPRGVWTSIQSGTMLVMYQYLLKQLEGYQGMEGAAL
ncbi:hypothetical protein N7450_005599 [Penicillium hetheringtonii]|uniref:Mitochondrial thiamine pyrophosphate carrier 1 n=1 Tax=Penicillium hetheringtonii TaxID=911720 RepID=A0AAD6DJE3_9EURO|nr:hypothetical protein N7450_005599 [Penicillium hetheringtonii]